MAALHCFSASLSKNKSSATKIYLNLFSIYSIANLLDAIQKCAQEHNLRVQVHDRTVQLCRHFAQSYRVKSGGDDGSRGPWNVNKTCERFDDLMSLDDHFVIGKNYGRCMWCIWHMIMIFHRHSVDKYWINQPSIDDSRQSCHHLFWSSFPRCSSWAALSFRTFLFVAWKKLKKHVNWSAPLQSEPCATIRVGHKTNTEFACHAPRMRVAHLTHGGSWEECVGAAGVSRPSKLRIKALTFHGFCHGKSPFSPPFGGICSDFSRPPNAEAYIIIQCCLINLPI